MAAWVYGELKVAKFPACFHPLQHLTPAGIFHGHCQGLFVSREVQAEVLTGADFYLHY